MATYTENYNLEKPAQSDLYNIDVFNENADKIDEALGDKAENQSLAPIESSATASRNYSVGQQFVYNGLLYEATSAIASGGTITPGSNCARTTVAEELSALNDSLTNLFDLLVITCDCTTAGISEMSGVYCGQYDLSTAERNGARYIIPLYARKSGYVSGPAISIEGSTVRLTNLKAISGVSCGLLRVY